MITIIDYGMGNPKSIVNMINRIGANSIVTSDINCIKDATKIILPGVGAFDEAMKAITASGLKGILNEKALSQKVPVLGICLGMQLLSRGSEEGSLPGLGWIEADTRRMTSGQGLKVPHMGWNVAIRTRSSPLTEGLNGEMRFYFVHSFFMKTDNPEDTVLRTHYGVDFAAAVQRENIMGTQFHPEKSHRFGMKLLQNFAELTC